ncbi:MAG: DnaA ATPase domain-containing protein, partial [Gemmatimonadaceae bacterium]
MDLDPRYRFENYIVGAANRLAVSAARAVGQSPGTSYNPLFIYSSSGLGKTHLMLAIGHLARQVQPAITVEYVTLEEFVEELNHAIGDSAMELFKQRFHMVDMLLLDDVQFLAGRKETQSEMLRLFNTLQRAGKQVVLTSDQPPAAIPELEVRLRSRFEGGLVVQIQAPDRTLREKLFARFLTASGREADAHLLTLLGQQPVQSVREIIGIVNRLGAAANAAGTQV